MGLVPQYPIQKPQIQKAHSSKLRRNVPAFLAGMGAALPLAILAAVPLVHSPGAGADVSTARPLQAQTVSETTSCTQPEVLGSSVTGGRGAGGGGGGEVLGDNTAINPSQLPAGGKGGEETPLPPPVLVQLTGTISDTGPGSTNTVINTVTDNTKVTNTTNVTVSNTSSQSSVTGSANVSGNTTGGDATSGTASNTNSTNLNLSVSN